MGTESRDIPETVVKQIEQKAREDWADDPDMVDHIIDTEFEAYRELQTMEVDNVPNSVLEELKDAAGDEFPGDYAEQRDFVEEGAKVYLYNQQVREKIEPIKDLLIKMESIIGNECYNTNMQNWGSGGIWEGEGRSFRYPITLELGDKSVKRRRVSINIVPETLMTGRYKFGANELNIFIALEKIVEMLQVDYGLDVKTGKR